MLLKIEVLVEEYWQMRCFRVVNIKVINKGINVFENDTRLFIEFLTISITSVKFIIINVTINIY